jgi:pilus assembly protein CpaF
MATIHANSARDAVAKLQTLPLLAGENISHDFIAPIVASSIDLVVHTTITRNQRESGASQTGKRRIVEIASVTGRIENGRVEIEPLFTFQGGKYESGLGNPRQVFERRNHYMVSRT